MKVPGDCLGVSLTWLATTTTTIIPHWGSQALHIPYVFPKGIMSECNACIDTPAVVLHRVAPGALGWSWPTLPVTHLPIPGCSGGQTAHTGIRKRLHAHLGIGAARVSAGSEQVPVRLEHSARGDAGGQGWRVRNQHHTLAVGLLPCLVGGDSFGQIQGGLTNYEVTFAARSSSWLRLGGGPKANAT
jgi:hypothetical protein